MNQSNRPATKFKFVSNQLFWGLLGAILLLALDSVALNRFSQAETTAQPQKAVETEVIYVNPQTGDDTAGEGSKQSPLKTITKALTVAKPNTVISLAPGTYSEETGESFPLIIRQKVTLKGSPEGQGYNVIIRGSGYFISPTAAGQDVTLVAIKDAEAIIGVSVINPQSRGHGLWIESASPKVTDNSFIRNGNTGVSVNGKSAPIIANNYFSRNGGNGLLVYGSSQPKVENNEFENTGFGVSVVQNAAPVLSKNHFQGNRIGIIVEGNSQATLRDNQIENSQEYGLVAIAQASVDLGTEEQPGDNVFRHSGKLDIQNASTNPIVAVGTQISGSTAGSIDFRGDNLPPSAIEKPLPTSSSTRSVFRADTSPQSAIAERGLRRGVQAGEMNSADNPSPIAPDSVNDNSSSPPPPPPPPPTIASPSTDANAQRQINPTAEPTEDNAQLLEQNSKEFVFTTPTSESQSLPETDSAVDNPSFAPPPVAIEPESSAQPEISPTPSAITGAANERQISSLSDLLTTSDANTAEYRVIVEASSSEQQAQVRSLYPDAFPTIYQGKSMLQVGVFSSRPKAENALQSLVNLGIDGVILD